MSADPVAFNHLGQCVTDLERSKRFYCELLGFTFQREIKPPDEEFDEIGQDPVGAEVLAPGRSAFTDGQMPWATSHSTRISPRTCSGTWSAHQRCTRATSSSESPPVAMRS